MASPRRLATTDRPDPAVQPLDKAPDAFRTISEVADDLDLPQHVLRFWETRFPQIKPLKRGGGRRYYRPDDVHLLRGIRRLLYGEGYTIKGVQKILRDQGLRYVSSLGRSGQPEQAPAPDLARSLGPGEPPPLDGPHLYAPPGVRAAQPALDAPPADDAPPAARAEIRVHPTADAGDAAWEDDGDPPIGEPEIRVDPQSRPVPTGAVLDRRPPQAGLVRSYHAAEQMRRTQSAAPIPPAEPEAPEIEADDFGEQAAEPERFLDDASPTDAPVEPDRPAFAPPPPYAEPHAPAPSFPLSYGPAPLPEESRRRLRGALAELAECRRLLEKAR